MLTVVYDGNIMKNISVTCSLCNDGCSLFPLCQSFQGRLPLLKKAGVSSGTKANPPSASQLLASTPHQTGPNVLQQGSVISRKYYRHSQKRNMEVAHHKVIQMYGLFLF